MQFHVIKLSNGQFLPAAQMDEEEADKLNVNQPYEVTLKKKRNPKFLRKYMAMVKVAFNAWEPDKPLPKYEKYGVPVKDFNRFRKDVQVVCGYYNPVYCIKSGEIRMEPISISFDSMDDVAFAELYDRVATYLLGHFLKNYTRDDLDEVVDKMIGFV